MEFIYFKWKVFSAIDTAKNSLRKTGHTFNNLFWANKDTLPDKTSVFTIGLFQYY